MRATRGNPHSATSRRGSLRPFAAVRGEEGFTIVELMVAMLVISIGLVALAVGMTSTLVSTAKVRIREAAVAEANRQIETQRATGYGLLLMNPAGAPTSYTADDGTTYTTLRDTAGTCTACVPYEQTITTANNGQMLVRTVIVPVDDPADGTGAADADQATVNGFLTDYKKVFVEVSTINQAPAITYKMETIIHDLTKDPAIAVQGLHLAIGDADNANAIVENPDLVWTVEIQGAGISGAPLAEGGYDNFALPPGTYTCVIAATPSTRNWHPKPDPALPASSLNSESFGCTVTADQVTTIVRSWQELTCQMSVDVTVTGKLNVLVVSGLDGSAGPGSTVTAVGQSGLPTTPIALVTDPIGLAAFSGLRIGPYKFGVTATTFNSQSDIDRCITTIESDDALTLVLQPVSVPGLTANVFVSVKSTIKGSNTFKAVLTAKANPLPGDVSPTISVTKDLDKNATGIFSFVPRVAGSPYTVQVYCVAKNDNLKTDFGTSATPKAVTAGSTYYFPGPAQTDVFTIDKC
jgi:prepilin-type N-terminal cleavage/methylation domain-containing protein